MASGKVLVTGANGGIGMATTIALARGGFSVLAAVRSAANGELVAAEARGAGVEQRVTTVLLDVTDAAACERVIGDGPLFGLVNNAGYTNVGAVEDVTEDDVRRQIETMLIAPLRLARLAIPGMREAHGGRIVNISSMFTFFTAPLSGYYQAAKRGLDAAMDSLRCEVAAADVKVISVQPGVVATGLWTEVDTRIDGYAVSRYARPYGRLRTVVRAVRPVMCEPADVANVVVRAMCAGSPRRAYRVGMDARVLRLWSNIAPRRLQDRVSRAVFGL